MAVEVVTSWKTLFRLASACGKARMAYKAAPNEANLKAMNEAIEAHEAYRKACLKAERMIGLPQFTDALS